ncbi:SDR family NAD(P)-dependent oxidoreductase [Kitasatospora terrestris]|uniref:3-oxoacyl-ACP reductase FabG n=1 Tax=Kitasatospora terrestris TaxID=258051 RepID=A0ABP9DMC0_9ACTN
MTVKDKVAVVTGGAKGLGEAIAETLLAEGARVVVAGREAAAAGSILELGGERAHFHPVDVRDADSVAALMAAARERFGGLDIVVANAAVNAPGPVERLTPAQWADALAVNLSGVYHCVHAAAPLLRAQGWGRIVTVSSALSQRPMAGASAYCATKAAVEALTRVAALELADAGVTVNCVSPGITDRGMSRALAADERMWNMFLPKLAAGRPGRGEEIGRVVAFLAGEEASYVNGTVVEVNGGMRH